MARTIRAPESMTTTPGLVVKDNVTGLVWEVKTDDTGIHDKDNTYRWGGITAIGKTHTGKKGTYYDDWTGLVNGTNSENLCGYNDWEVLTREELISIVNYNKTSLTIDENFFPNTSSAGYWSSSPDAVNSDYAWIVSFASGNDNGSTRYDYYRSRFNHR